MQIRKVIENDIDTISAFYMESYNQTDENKWTLDKAKKRIIQLFSKVDSHCFIFEDCDQIFGFAMGYCEELSDSCVYFLTDVVIEQSIRGNGYGTMILTELETYLKNIKVDKILLLSNKNELNQKFFEKSDFIIEKNIICMTKTL